MDTLNSSSYCVFCSIALLHEKLKIYKSILNLLYTTDYFLFNHTKRDIKRVEKSTMYT